MKTRSRYLFSSRKLSGVSQTRCARLVQVFIVVALGVKSGCRMIRLVICRCASVLSVFFRSSLLSRLTKQSAIKESFSLFFFDLFSKW